VALRDERILGQLEHDARGEFARLQDFREGAHEIQIACLLCGDVDADGRGRTKFLIEAFDRSQCLGQHKVRDGVDQAELDGQTDERAGRMNLPFVIAPADERLESDDFLSQTLVVNRQQTSLNYLAKYFSSLPVQEARKADNGDVSQLDHLPVKVMCKLWTPDLLCAVFRFWMGKFSAIYISKSARCKVRCASHERSAIVLECQWPSSRIA